MSAASRKELARINGRGHAHGWHAQQLQAQASREGRSMADSFRDGIRGTPAFNVPAEAVRIERGTVFYRFADGSEARFPRASRGGSSDLMAGAEGLRSSRRHVLAVDGLQQERLLELASRLDRGCDCEYDYRCGNCQAVLDMRGFVSTLLDRPLLTDAELYAASRERLDSNANRRRFP